jgi:hypothetical protein
MTLTDPQREFLTANHSAAMVTVTPDGVAKVARVGVALVDGKLWSSGTADRVRTKRLRNDPRCTLYVHDAGFAFLGLETTVTILDGPDAAALNVRLFRLMQARPTGPLSWFGGEYEEADFLARMEAEGRLIYEFDVRRAYGLT